MSQTNYQKLIDSETWAFIKKSKAYYPDAASKKTIGEQRQIYQKLCLAFSYGRPVGVKTREYIVQDVPVRRYRLDGVIANGQNKGGTHSSEKCLIVFFHGGGFVLGNLDSHDDICAELCASTGHDLVAVDYRLAPEHCHPAMFKDAIQTTRSFVESDDLKIILCGDSAGGNLAAAVAHELRGETDRIIGQLLIYPSLGPVSRKGSYAMHAHAPMLTRSDMKFYLDSRCRDASFQIEKTLYPLVDSDFSELPPTVIITAECDPLSDDGRNYCDLIRSAGGKAVWINEKGLVHGFLRARKKVRRASSSFKRIIEFLSMLGNIDWCLERY